MGCKQCEKKDERIAELRHMAQMAAETVIKVKRENRQLRREIKASASTVRPERKLVGSKGTKGTVRRPCLTAKGLRAVGGLGSAARGLR